MLDDARRRRRWRLLALPIVVLLVTMIIVLNSRSKSGSGVSVTVQNISQSPMHSVVIHVTGGTYPLGDLAPGASARATVKPTGQTHLDIDYSDAAGKKHELRASGPFDDRFQGTIGVSIKDGVIQQIDRRMNFGT